MNSRVFTDATSSKVNETVGGSAPRKQRARIAIGIRHCAPRRKEAMSPHPMGHDGIDEDTEDTRVDKVGVHGSAFSDGA